MEQATFPMVPLGSVLRRAERFERRDDNTQYRFAGVYSFSKGLFFREPVAGTTFKLPQIQRLREGDFVYSKIMAWEGAFALASAEAHDTVLSGAFLVYEIDRTQVLPEYLKFYFQNRKVWKTIGAKSSGTNVRRQSLAPEIFEKELFPLPTINEQQIVVERLLEESSIQAQIKLKHHKSASLLTSLRQAILREAVQGRLLPQDPADEPASVLLTRIRTEKQRLVKEKLLRSSKPLPLLNELEFPFELPKSWVWERLGNALLKLTDGTHHSPVNTSKGDFKYITAKNIRQGRIDLSTVTYISASVHNEIYSRCNPELGDVLYIKDGATTGIVAINTLDEPFSLLSSVALLKPSEGIFNQFLFLLLSSGFFYDMMRADMSGIAITRVTLTKLAQAPIPLPPLAEQHRIVAKVTELLGHCTGLEVELDRARAASSALHAAALREAFFPTLAITVN